MFKKWKWSLFAASVIAAVMMFSGCIFGVDVDKDSFTSVKAVGSDGKVQITWTTETGDFEAFFVHRSLSSSMSDKERIKIVQNENSCVDTDVVNGTTYYYQVEGILDKGDKSVLSDVVSATPEVFPNAKSIVADMGFGFNLGNTLDANGTSGLAAETYWGMPYTTQDMIKGIAKAGFKTVRLPVSWHDHMDASGNIDSAWMARVKTIVDWIVAEDMYVIINIHHDNRTVSESPISAYKGFTLLDADKTNSMNFVKKVWTQICAEFKDYDQHVIFETLNEPRLIGDTHEWGFTDSCATCKKAIAVLNEMNDEIVKLIRKSGGNNGKRLVSVPSVCCSPDAALSSTFTVPTDSNIAVAVHMYTPWDFAMQGSYTSKTFTSSHKDTLDSYFDQLYTKFVSKGTPVYIGEMGATNKDNTEEREKWFTYFVSHANAKGIPSILWDNGVYKCSESDCEEKYGFYDRNSQTWYFPSLIKAGVTAAGGKVGSIPEFKEQEAGTWDESKAETLLSNFDVANWAGQSISSAKFSSVKAGSMLKFETAASSTEGTSFILLKKGNWNDLDDDLSGVVTGDAATLSGKGFSVKTVGGSFVYTLSAKDAEVFKANGMIVTGTSVKVTVKAIF